MKHSWHNAGSSVCPFKLHMQIVDDESQLSSRRGTLLILSHWVEGQGHLWHYVKKKPYWHDKDYIFAWSLLNFLIMYTVNDERKNPIDFGTRGKWSRSSLALCLWRILGIMQTIIVLADFRTPSVSCWWWEEEPYWFWVTGSKLKVKLLGLWNLVGTS